MGAEYLNQLFGLEGQVVVVIGGTGVLGGAMSEGLAKAGAHVIVAGRSEERGRQRVEAIQSAGGSASFAAVEATSRVSIEKLLQSTLETHDRIHGLVNGMGVNSATPYLEITDDEFQNILDTNLKSTHMACQTFLPHMVDQGGGAILNVGSASCFTALSRVYTYSASKAAVLNLTQNLAREFAPHHIRVNCLCPGFFPAEQNRKVLTEDRIASIFGHTPMDRFGEPDELIGATLLLLSPAAGSFVTGTTVYVDGGFTCMTI